MSSGPALVDQRRTRQRAGVQAVLAESDHFLSAQELHRRLVDRGERVGLTTVYRALQSMANDGAIDTLRNAGGESLYRKCQRNSHHHHLVCRNCGRAVEVAGPSIERWAARIASDHGFADTTHTVEVFGVCTSCARKSRRKRSR